MDDLLKVGGDFGIEDNRRHRRSIEDGRQNKRRGLAGKWSMPRDAFVEHDAQGEQIGSTIELIAGDLLRRHIRRSSDRDALGSYWLGCGLTRGRREGLTGQQFGEAEVEDLDLSTIDQEEICRLDVAMDNSSTVCPVEGVSHLNADVDDLMDLEGLGTGEAVSQRQAFHQFHDEEGSAFVLADVVDRADVRVIQRGGRPGFGSEPFHGRQIIGQVLGHELECHGTAQTDIFGSVHDAHPACAELADDSIVGDGLSQHAGPAFFGEP